MDRCLSCWNRGFQPATCVYESVQSRCFWAKLLVWSTYEAVLSLTTASEIWYFEVLPEMSLACGWTVGSLPRFQCLNTWGQHDSLGDGSCIPLQVPVPRGRGLGDASSRDGPEDKDVTQCGSRINIPAISINNTTSTLMHLHCLLWRETLQQKKPLFSLHCIESWNCFKFFKRKDTKMFRFESYRKPSTFQDALLSQRL